MDFINQFFAQTTINSEVSEVSRISKTKELTTSNKKVGSFKANCTLIDRINESKRLAAKYPDRIPIICETDESTFNLDKTKYLVPGDLTIKQFMYVIRKRIKLAPEEAIFLYCAQNLPTTGTTIEELCRRNRDEDGFMYFVLTSENVFG